QNLVILNYLNTDLRQYSCLECFDWGSQSIAQSKFQRALPQLEERVRREHFIASPSILFSKKLLEKLTNAARTLKERPSFRIALQRCQPKGVRTMETHRLPSSVFLEKNTSVS